MTEKKEAKKNVMYITVNYDNATDTIKHEARKVLGFTPELVFVKPGKAEDFEQLVNAYINYAQLKAAKADLARRTEAEDKKKQALAEATEKAAKDGMLPSEQAKATLEKEEAERVYNNAVINRRKAEKLVELWGVQPHALPEVADYPALIVACVVSEVARKYYDTDTSEARRKEALNAPYNVYNVFNPLLTCIQKFFADNIDLSGEGVKITRAALQDFRHKLIESMTEKLATISESEMYSAWDYSDLNRDAMRKLIKALQGRYYFGAGHVQFGISDADAREQIALHLVDIWEQTPAVVSYPESGIPEENRLSRKTGKTGKKTE